MLRDFETDFAFGFSSSFISCNIIFGKRERLRFTARISVPVSTPLQLREITVKHDLFILSLLISQKLLPHPQNRNDAN